MQLTTKVELTGNIFKGVAPQILNQIVNDGIRELVQLGETYLMNNLKTGGLYLGTELVGGGRKQTSTGNYRRNISTSVSNLHGKIDDGGVVYGPWLEGISSRNYPSTKFKGYSAFRKASQKMEKGKHSIFRKQLDRYVRKMNA
jgi:hypothetical protein